jgi:hypothetical protein
MLSFAHLLRLEPAEIINLFNQQSAVFSQVARDVIDAPTCFLEASLICDLDLIRGPDNKPTVCVKAPVALLRVIPKPNEVVVLSARNLAE